VIDGVRPAGDPNAIAETLARLKRAGLTGDDRAQLRFSFVAPGLRTAVELASTLRTARHNRVQVRPAPRRLLRTYRWNVIVTTPPAPLLRPVIRLWSTQMEELAETRPGCAMVGWQPVVDGTRRD
jgi:hypothetical protein